MSSRSAHQWVKLLSNSKSIKYIMRYRKSRKRRSRRNPSATRRRKRASKAINRYRTARGGIRL
jgi:hypothetical protein